MRPISENALRDIAKYSNQYGIDPYNTLVHIIIEGTGLSNTDKAIRSSDYNNTHDLTNKALEKLHLFESGSISTWKKQFRMYHGDSSDNKVTPEFVKKI